MVPSIITRLHSAWGIGRPTTGPSAPARDFLLTEPSALEHRSLEGWHMAWKPDPSAKKVLEKGARALRAPECGQSIAGEEGSGTSPALQGHRQGPDHLFHGHRSHWDNCPVCDQSETQPWWNQSVACPHILQTGGGRLTWGASLRVTSIALFLPVICFIHVTNVKPCHMPPPCKVWGDRGSNPSSSQKCSSRGSLLPS